MLKNTWHYIERDTAGNLGLAWLIEFRDWERFSLWLKEWSTHHPEEGTW